MTFTQISDRLWIGPQPDIHEFGALKNEGFAKIVNLRPDDEDADQPGNNAERRSAADHGLGYVFIPVALATITEADVQAFARATTEAEGKLFVHCKSGIRALTLYVLSEVLAGRMRRDQIADIGRRYGHDLAQADRGLDLLARQRPKVKGFYDPRTYSVQYVVSDPATGKCAIIDPVLDYDEKSGATKTESADAILQYISERELAVEWILDTHPHADHFSAAHYLQTRTGARTAIGDHVVDVQKLWKEIYNWPSLQVDGSQWDNLFADGAEFSIGSLKCKVMFSPGHTLASITYLIGDAAFVHDTLFQPDSGTARADFPGGNAHSLWSSIQSILSLPDETRLFTGHDYQPQGREPKWESTVAQQKRDNRHISGMDEARFVQVRSERDRTLAMPRLILHALQVNIRGGRLPEREANGRRYLKIPLDALEGAVW